ncbi:MAG: S41 family peptidase [Pseudomonadota bacterium]
MPVFDRRYVLKTGAAIASAAMVSPRVLAQNLGIAEDIKVLRAALDIHPGALRYLNPAALEAALEEFETTFVATEALETRYLVLSRFLSKLRCGHSYANFYNQSETVSAALFDRRKRLPFAFRWIEDEMVVTDAPSEPGLSRGSVVTDINGVAPGDMLHRLLPYTRADGAAPGKRRALLDVQHRARLEYFDIFHGLIYGAPADGVHRITARTPLGAEVSVDAPAIDLAERQAMRKAAIGARGSGDPLWDFEIRDGVGLLTMPSWSTYDTDWDWRSWLDGTLDEVADLRGLIVDNRRNEGGNPEVGAVLLSRLIAEAVPLPDIRRLVRFRTFPQDLRPHVKTWDPSFYTIGEGADAIGYGFYELPAAKQITEIAPRGTPVDVPTVLLTSPTNSSAAFTFALIAQSTGRMKLVGAPTGGNRRGINGDGFFFTTLPVSGIEFDLPMVGQFPATPQPDAGIVPDILVSETAADIAAGRDATLAMALSLF